MFNMILSTNENKTILEIISGLPMPLSHDVIFLEKESISRPGVRIKKIK